MSSVRGHQDSFFLKMKWHEYTLKRQKLCDLKKITNSFFNFQDFYLYKNLFKDDSQLCYKIYSILPKVLGHPF